MVQYRDLNAPPSRMLADVVADMRAAERQSKTGEAGVKDLGESGDLVWPRPDGTPVSVRDVDLELEDARVRIGEAEESLVQTGERLEAAEGTVAGVAGDLSRVETVVIPGAVADLEAADQANAQAVADAETRSDQARADLAAQIDQDIADAANALSSDINSVRTSVDGKSKITQSLDAPPAQYAGAVGDRWERMSSLGSGGRLVSNWRWNGTTWVSTIIDGAVLGNVDASTISAGFLDSARIKAGSIYADKIVSGLSQNMVPDAGFANPAINTQRLSAAFGYGGATFAIGDGLLRITLDGTSAGHPNMALGGNSDLYAWTAYPGMKLATRFDARVTSGVARLNAVVRYELRDGTRSSATMGANQYLTSAWATYTWSYEFPQDIKGFTVVLQVNRTDGPSVVEVRSPFAAAPTGTTLIEDGAVTTGKVAANAIVAGKIAAGAVEAGHIKAGAITVGTVDGLSGELAGKETPAGAQAKADAAKIEAQQAAAADAQSKADAARTAAEDAAKTYADAVADGASQAAIDAAEADATAKANAAEAAAVAAAGVAAAAEYGETKTLVGGWRETGQTTIAGGAISTDSITAGHLKSGAVTTAKLAVTEDMSAAIVNAMSVNAKNLVVTEEAILNHATLIGQTVVDDINVQGKLVGTDGVFTGTVDFENVNVTGELLANEISGEYLYGTVIEGGEIRTSDALPGQVAIRDDGYVDGNSAAYPGIRVTPTVTHNPDYPPGIGANETGLIVTGGTSAGGDRSFASVHPDAAVLRSRNEGEGRDSSLYANKTEAVMYSQGATGARGTIRARSTFADVAVFDSAGAEISAVYATPHGAGVSFGQGLNRRLLSVDSSGVWVETNKSGTTERWNLEETASDSGWRTFPMNSALAGAGSPAYRIKSGTVFLRGSITLPSANWSAGWTTVGVLPAAATPTFDVQRPTITSAMSQVPETYLQVNTSGQLQVWIPRSVAGTTIIQLSPMLYVAG